MTSATPEVALTHRQVMTILSGLMAGLFLAAIDQTIVATALPTIVGDLGNLTHLPWVVTAYLMTSTTSTPLYGKLGDLYGRRIVFQFAIVVFIAGSVLCAVSQTMIQLIGSRAIQGIGGGGLMALAFTIIGDILPPRQRGRYMGYFSAVFAVAGVAGPVLGGFFVDHLTWRWAFWVKVPIGVVAMVIVSVNLRLPLPRAERRVDYLGGALLVAAVSCVLLVAAWGGNRYPWASAPIAWLIVASVVLGLVFVLWERRAREPMLPLRLFANPVVAVATAIGFVISAAMFVSIVFLPLFLQAVTGVSATNSGLLIAPTMAGVTISSVAAGRRMTTTGRYKRYLIVGVALALAPIAGLTQIDVNTPAVLIGTAMFTVGLGMGLVFPILNMAAQNSVAFADIGTATSTVRFSQSLGGTLTVAGAGAIVASRLQSGLDALARDPIVGPLLPSGLEAETIASSPLQIRALEEPLRSGVIAALAEAVSFAFLLALPFVVVAFALAWLMKELPLRETIGTPPPVPPPAPVPSEGPAGPETDGRVTLSQPTEVTNRPGSQPPEPSQRRDG